MAFPTDWAIKCKLTIQSAKVPTTLTDFPVLLDLSSLPSEMFDADGTGPALNGGGDIRFSSDVNGATQLPCEVVSFVTDNNPANGSAEIYVKVPSVASASNTDIYIWYGKSGEVQPIETDTYGKHNVWDSNFVLVMHLNDVTTSTVNDSTSNGINGTKYAANEPVEATGVVGKGQSFDGSNDRILTPNASDALDITTTLTLEAIIKPSILLNSSQTDYRTIISRQQIPTTGRDSYIIAINPSGKLHLGSQGGSIQGTQVSWASDTVYHIAGTYNSTGLTGNLYVDGVAEVLTLSSYDAMAGGSNSLVIGTWSTATLQHFPGIIDEVRISKVVRSADWILTTYNNLSDPATFVVEGTPTGLDVSGDSDIIMLFPVVVSTGFSDAYGDGDCTVEVTLAATAQVPVNANSDITLGVPVVSITAHTAVHCNGESTFTAPIVTATGNLATAATVSLELPSLTGAATGGLSGGNGEIEIPVLDCDITAQIGIAGNASCSMPVSTFISTGVVSVIGTLSVSLPSSLLLAYGLRGVTGEGSLQLPSLVLFSNSGFEGSVEFPSLELAATGMINAVAEPVLTLPSLKLNSTGQVTLSEVSPVDIIFPAFTLVATGQVSVIGELNLTLPSLKSSITGQLSGSSSGEVLLSKLSLSSQGVVSGGVGGVTFPKFTLASTGLSGRVGNGVCTLPNFIIDSVSGGEVFGNGDLTFPPFTTQQDGSISEGSIEATTDVILRHHRY